MSVTLRCSQKLLKRLRQPATPPEPPPADNPLGEWCADIDFIDRAPFVLVSPVPATATAASRRR